MGTLEMEGDALGFSAARDIPLQLEEQDKLKKAYSDLEKNNAELKKLNKKLEIREKQLAHREYHDVLTGLPNRSILLKNLDDLINSIHENKKLAMLFIDLDNFKFVNDRFGYSKGDEILQEACKRVW